MDYLWALGALRARRRLIVAVAIVGANLGLVLAVLFPTTFTAQTRIVVGSITEPEPARLSAYEQLARTYGQLAGTSPVLARVVESAGLDWSVSELAKHVTVRVPEAGAILTVTVTADRAALAAELANALADEIVRLATPPAAAGGSLATIVEPAGVPLEPSSPSAILVFAIATLIGLLVGAALALRIEFEAANAARRSQALRLLDDRIQSRAG